MTNTTPEEDERASIANFFDQYPRFFETSKTSAIPRRLNARFLVNIQRNQAIIVGNRLLDIGSHDGRWTFAALKAGAKHVTGVEPRSKLIAHARENMRAYGMEEHRYSFVEDDIFAFLRGGNVHFDVVLCMGYFYHTLRHMELVRLLANVEVQHVILDTEVYPTGTGRSATGDFHQKDRSPWGDCVIQLLRDPVAEEMMAWEDEYTVHGHTIVGRPSVGAIHLLFGQFGFSVVEMSWDSAGAYGWEGLADYQGGWRKTFLCTRT